jgi:CheY-like chemotaxis protein
MAPPLPILLVDDEPSVRRLAQRMLEMDGHTVVEAGAGGPALAAAGPFQLALVDYKLPDMSGQELILQLRERQPDLPVVVMSGYASDVLEPAPAGAARVVFLAKPFSRGTLREQIAAALAP